MILKEIEEEKIRLTMKYDFNIVDAFRIFDPNCTGFITLKNFTDGLK